MFHKQYHNIFLLNYLIMLLLPISYYVILTIKHYLKYLNFKSVESTTSFFSILHIIKDNIF